MRQIELPGKGFNPDEIARFAQDLGESFNPVRVRFFKAVYKSSDSDRPSNTFHTDPASANYVMIHLNRREAIHYYKRGGDVGGRFLDENLSDDSTRIVLNKLLANRMRNIPAPKIQVLPTQHVQQEEPILSKIISSFLNLFKSRS